MTNSESPISLDIFKKMVEAFSSTSDTKTLEKPTSKDGRLQAAIDEFYILLTPSLITKLKEEITDLAEIATGVFGKDEIALNMLDQAAETIHDRLSYGSSNGFSFGDLREEFVTHLGTRSAQNTLFREASRYEEFYANHLSWVILTMLGAHDDWIYELRQSLAQ